MRIKKKTNAKNAMNIFIAFLTLVFFNPHFLSLFLPKIVTVSSSFFGHSILRLITISRGRLRINFGTHAKIMHNRHLLIVISTKIECPKNDDEKVTILTKIVKK